MPKLRSTLTPKELKILNCLIDDSDMQKVVKLCYKTHQQIADETTTSRSYVKSQLNRLCDLGVLDLAYTLDLEKVQSLMEGLEQPA